MNHVLHEVQMPTWEGTILRPLKLPINLAPFGNSCIWHHNVTNKLSLQIEAIQRRAIKIIFECTRHMSYANSLYLAELASLQHRAETGRSHEPVVAGGAGEKTAQ